MYLNSLLLIIITLYICLSSCNKSLKPCQDYTCDSLVIRNILDLNGQQKIKVELRAKKDTTGRVAKLKIIKLKDIPKTIGKLTALRELSINHCGLETLLPEVGMLYNLERLELFGNKLTTLPQELERLKSLKFLGIATNKFKHIPPVIEHMENLETLWILHTPLESLPAFLAKMPKLKSVVASRNEISSIAPEVIPMLQKISIDHNKLCNLPDSTEKLITKYARSGTWGLINGTPFRQPNWKLTQKCNEE